MMQASLVADIDVSPKLVRKFYKDIPKDSIPMVNTQYEINQILVYPAKNENARNEAREKLLSLRQRIVDGERFSTLAVLYSQDPGSARRGGELGFKSRDELDPEFAGGHGGYAYGLAYNSFFDPYSKVEERVRTSYKRALEIDEYKKEALMAKAVDATLTAYDFVAAEQAVRKALPPRVPAR